MKLGGFGLWNMYLEEHVKPLVPVDMNIYGIFYWAVATLKYTDNWKRLN